MRSARRNSIMRQSEDLRQRQPDERSEEHQPRMAPWYHTPGPRLRRTCPTTARTRRHHRRRATTPTGTTTVHSRSTGRREVRGAALPTTPSARARLQPPRRIDHGDSRRRPARSPKPRRPGISADNFSATSPAPATNLRVLQRRSRSRRCRTGPTRPRASRTTSATSASTARARRSRSRSVPREPRPTSSTPGSPSCGRARLCYGGSFTCITTCVPGNTTTPAADLHITATFNPTALTTSRKRSASATTRRATAAPSR